MLWQVRLTTHMRGILKLHARNIALPECLLGCRAFVRPPRFGSVSRGMLGPRAELEKSSFSTAVSLLKSFKRSVTALDLDIVM